MSLRHTKEIFDFKIASCPPQNCVDEERNNVYRFSKTEHITTATFETPYEIKPCRMNPLTTDKNLEKPCSLLALSFYISEESARTAYLQLKSEIPNFRMTHLVSGIILVGYGMSSPPNKKSGHFDHHPYKDTYYKDFDLVGEL